MSRVLGVLGASRGGIQFIFSPLLLIETVADSSLASCQRLDSRLYDLSPINRDRVPIVSIDGDRIEFEVSN